MSLHETLHGLSTIPVHHGQETGGLHQFYRMPLGSQIVLTIRWNSKEIKKLKFSEPHKFQRKVNEDQYKFNLKLTETTDNAK